jgi:hypothetical protein
MKTAPSNICAYYQAIALKEKHWILTAFLRSFEHLAFDRTCDTEKGIFEFFVPQDLEHYFLDIMKYLHQEGIIWDLQKLPNRLGESDTQF